MDVCKGGGPCFNTEACGTIALASSFFAPVIGSVLITGVCMLAVDCDGEDDGSTEWW